MPLLCRLTGNCKQKLKMRWTAFSEPVDLQALAARSCVHGMGANHVALCQAWIGNMRDDDAKVISSHIGCPTSCVHEAAQLGVRGSRELPHILGYSSAAQCPRMSNLSQSVSVRDTYIDQQDLAVPSE